MTVVLAAFGVGLFMKERSSQWGLLLLLLQSCWCKRKKTGRVHIRESKSVKLATAKRIQVQETQINGALNRFNYLPAPEFLVKLKGGINSHWGYARKDVTLFNVGLPLPLPQFPICVRHMWDFKSMI